MVPGSSDVLWPLLESEALGDRYAIYHTIVLVNENNEKMVLSPGTLIQVDDIDTKWAMVVELRMMGDGETLEMTLLDLKGE